MIQLHFPPIKLRSVSSLRLFTPLLPSVSSLCFFIPLLLFFHASSLHALLSLHASSLLTRFFSSRTSSLLLFTLFSCCERPTRIFNISAFSELDCGICEKRWGDLLDFLFKKVGVPMFWNRGPVKVPLPLSDEKQGGGGERILLAPK